LDFSSVVHTKQHVSTVTFLMKKERKVTFTELISNLDCSGQMNQKEKWNKVFFNGAVMASLFKKVK